MKRGYAILVLLLVTISCIYAATAPTPKSYAFKLMVTKPTRIDVQFFSDSHCTIPLDNINFGFISNTATVSKATFYIRWSIAGDTPLNISLIAAARPGTDFSQPDYCLIHEMKGAGGSDIGLNYQISVKGIDANSPIVAKETPSFQNDDVKKVALLPVAERTLADIYTTKKGRDENAMEVTLTAYAPLDSNGKHSFLQGTGSGYIHVRLTSI